MILVSNSSNVRKDACLVQAESYLAQAQQDFPRMKEAVSVSDDRPPEQVPVQVAKLRARLHGTSHHEGSASFPSVACQDHPR